MTTMDPYTAKAIEYLVGIGFLILFAGFWKYATGGKTAACRPRKHAPAPVEMFRVPEGVMVHPGHTWARADTADVVFVGIDEFAQHLVGQLHGIVAPRVGDRVEQGATVLNLKADSQAVDVLAPVTGEVLAVNQRALTEPTLVNDDPYGKGWLLKVRVPALAIASNQLLTGRGASHLMASSWEELAALFSPELGTVMHDGGLPVNGLARAVDPVHWDEVARRFLLT